MNNLTRVPRTLVICFDGTNGMYNASNTNLMKFFSLLLKDKADRQHVYYQPGVGTYTDPAIWTPILNFVARMLDEALAWYLNAHVIGGYQFLMNNYREGDKICIFGFSRGAYTARALAGMITKIGLMPANMPEEVPFAYSIYQDTSAKNKDLSAGFKQAFSRSVTIEFVGCWETVSSVGIIWGRHLPFTDSNNIIRTFRHAVALDEHRARFQPNLWRRDAETEPDAKNDPEHATRCASADGDFPDRPPTDVKEVWFAGGHEDVGGGAVPDATEYASGDIPLRWMVYEVMKSDCGILFDPDALRRANINIPSFHTNDPNSSASTEVSEEKIFEKDRGDALAPLDDQLKKTPIWWILEILPVIYSYQDEKGAWHWTQRMNLGRGRKVYGDILLHESVKLRENDPSMNYTPKTSWTGVSRWVRKSFAGGEAGTEPETLV